MTKSRLLFQSPLLCSTTSTKPTVSSTPKISKPMHLTDSIRTSSLIRRSVSTTILNETATKFIEPIIESISTPVSRTCSNEFHENQLIVECDEPANENLTEISIEKKSLEIDIFSNDIDEIPIHNGISSDIIKSRYKSEPNLSRILTDHNMSSTPIHPNHTKYSSTNQSCNDSNKLTKGVSLDNLKWFTPCTNFPTPTILLKSNDSKLSSKEISILDDPDFEATPNSESSFDCQSNEIYTPMELVGIGRESMSPIRQATQRMSRAMQVNFILFFYFLFVFIVACVIYNSIALL